ncbi:MAG: hypothetical protein V4564_12330, partial [Pseudomonadota bacterium]
PIGRFLHRVTVEMPAAAASRLSRANVAIGIVVLLLAVLHASAGDADPVRFVSLFAPDLAIWLTSFEISAVIEAAVGLATAWAAMRRRVNISSVLATLHVAKHPRSKPGRARSSRRRNRASPANDDEDGAGLALAS